MGAPAKTTTTSDTSSGPWGPQQGYLTAGLEDANKVLQQQTSAGPYQGSYYAGANGIQTGAANAAAGYANGQGGALTGQLAGTAQGLMPSAQQYAGNAAGIASGSLSAAPNSGAMNTLNTYGSTGQIAGQNTALNGAIGQAGVNGTGALSQAQGTLGQVAQTGLTNQTGNTINNATQFANSGYLQQQMAANNALTNQTLNERTLPGLNRQAALGGNMNSSRAGAAQAQAQEGAALVNAQSNAAMQSSAYNSGLTLSAQQQEAGLNSANSAANNMQSGGLGAASLANNANQFNTTSQLGAAQGALSSQLGYDQLNNQTALAGNSQLGTAGALGITAGQAANQSAAANLATGEAAGGVLQTDAQNQLQAAQTAYAANNGGYNAAALNNYWNVVKQPLGVQGATTQTVTAPANTAGQIAGGALSLASLAAPAVGGVSALGNLYNGIKSLF